MSRTITWMIITLFVAQFMVVGIGNITTLENNDEESTPSENVDLDYISTESSDTSGRDAPHIDCEDYNGLGGPVWENDDPYDTSDIVEYPPNTGNYYILSELNITNMNTTMSPVDNNSADLWSGPCTCAQIAVGGVPTWELNTIYNPWQIVAWNSTYWVAQDAGAPVDEEPGNESTSGTSVDFWGPCSERTPCTEFDGHGGSVWDSTTSYSINDTVEWPANSGLFWMSITSGPTGEPASNGKWIGPCSCLDIWAASSSLVWDSNTSYGAGMMVEFPAGSQDIWMAIAPSTTMGVDPTYAWADGNEWELCSSGEPDGSPCAGLTVVGVWDSAIGTNIATGEIYEYPANSDNLYQVNSGGPFTSVSAPDVDLDVWSPIACPCEETWNATGQPVWDSNTIYQINSVVEWPAGSMDLWMAIAPSTTIGVNPTHQWADGNEWELCSQSNGSPCAGLTVVGVWDSAIGTNIATGEIYEYPANSDNLYQVNSGGPFTSVSAPDVDLDVWSPIACPCEETWNATGQPVWDSSSTYQIHSVVEWPAGSMDLWMAYAIQGAGEEPGVDAEWRLCHEGSPCAGLTVVGVWDTTMNVTSGEIYEYPANSHNLYQVNPGSPFWSVSAPDVDMDVWSPIDCPCNETWDANGQPVWDATVDYPGFYVVEWPAGSGTLYIPLESSGVSSGTEPGVDTHWVLCESTSPCAGLTVVGVWDATIGTNITTGEIYEYSNNLYQVNSGGPFTSVSAPDIDLDVWSPISCPCKETWAANGQPVWDSAINYYAGNYVVEWPAGSTTLYISEAGGITGAGEPGVDGHWIPCDPTTPYTSPCAGLTVVGVWDATIGTNIATGEIYEYSDNLYEVNSGGPFTSVSAPDVDLDVWTPIDCPCKETWVANGQPVWDSANTGYPGNYVVEWGAGTGILYISEGGGLTSSAGEPGVDTHWTPCVEQTPIVDEEKGSWIPSIGIFGTLIASSLGLIVATRRREII